MGREGTEKCLFKNEGKLKADVKLRTNEQNGQLQISPANFNIEAGNEVNVNLKYKPEDAGIFRGIIDVETSA